MKRLIPATVLLILIVIICTVSDITICRKVKNAKEEITKCEQLYQNSEFEKAEKSAIEFKKHWLKTSKIVSAYSNHCPLDDISVLSAILPEAIKAKDDFEFYSTVSQIKTALYTLYREQHFTIESLY